MSDDGFFSFLGRLGSDLTDLQQGRAIKELRQDVESNAMIQRDGHSTDFGRLEHKIATLGREVAVLRVALDVLSHALVEIGGLDAGALDARLKAALAVEEARTPLPAVVCGNCSLSYKASDVVATPDGPRCKRCRDL